MSRDDMVGLSLFSRSSPHVCEREVHNDDVKFSEITELWKKLGAGGKLESLVIERDSNFTFE